MTEIDLMQNVVNFGAAGLMGLLWTWERAMSRQRERQLSEAHERLMLERTEINVLTDLIERNTRASIRFEETQANLCRLLEQTMAEDSKAMRDMFQEPRRPNRDAPQDRQP